jgi:hypothetical protein
VHSFFFLPPLLDIYSLGYYLPFPFLRRAQFQGLRDGYKGVYYHCLYTLGQLYCILKIALCISSVAFVLLNRISAEKKRRKAMTSRTKDIKWDRYRDQDHIGAMGRRLYRRPTHPLYHDQPCRPRFSCARLVPRLDSTFESLTSGRQYRDAGL